MRHQRSGKKLGRDSAHRKALYANLTGALIEHGRIKTTVTKAKAVKPIAEQMITLGRRGDIHARRQAVAFLRSKDVVHKLFAEVGPHFAERPGGYIRIIRHRPAPGDAAEMVYLELVDTPLVFKTKLSDVDGTGTAVSRAEEPRRRAGGRGRGDEPAGRGRRRRAPRPRRTTAVERAAADEPEADEPGAAEAETAAPRPRAEARPTRPSPRPSGDSPGHKSRELRRSRRAWR